MTGKSKRSAGRMAVLLVAAVALLALAERGARWAWGRYASPVAGAQWIWAQPHPADGAGVSFFAVKDFELAAPVESARLLLQADEEFLALLNGRPVGFHRLKQGEPLPAYEVGKLLRTGVNRLSVELRSGRGWGGFLARLEIGGRHGEVIVTNSSWRIARQASPALAQPDQPLEGTEPPRVWGAPPTGRWEVTLAGKTSRPLAERLAAHPPLKAWQARAGEQQGSWVRLGTSDWRSPPIGRWVTFDWGEVVTGYLQLVFAGLEGARGLVFLGEKPPDPEHDPVAVPLYNVPGRRSWTDAQPRRFRYVTVVADTDLAGARAHPLPGAKPVKPTHPQRIEGLLGLERWELRAPVEDEIRSELEGLAGVPGG